MNDSLPYIICIDDEESVLETLQNILTEGFKYIFQIGTASSGEDGLELIDALINDRKSISLVICDHRMPDMEGMDVLSSIHEDYPDIKKIMLTAYGQDVSLVKRSIHQAHVDLFLDKPIKDTSELIEKIKNLLPITYSISSVDVLLESVHKKMRDHKIAESGSELRTGLSEIRSKLSNNDWKKVISKCNAHPIFEILQNDPFTNRVYSKPRGYAGDAVMMDMLYYQNPSELDKKLKLDNELFNLSSNAKTSKAVRSRRKMVAKLIDSVASSVDKPRILSVACGHLREIELTNTAKEGKIKEYIAFDSDPESIKEIEDKYYEYPVTTIKGSVRQIITNKVKFNDLDFIYTLGLFDYLNDKIAQHVTIKLFNALNSGGKLLIANFLPDLEDIGYMEAFMDWHLIYRDEMGMISILNEIPRNEIRNINIYYDEYDQIVFIDVDKR